MALVPGMNSQDVLAPVMEATKAEILRSYADAVAAHSSHASNTSSGLLVSYCFLPSSFFGATG